MADYYPLLARALDALPDRSPALRRAVYDRARNALIGQLRSLDPPLPESAIDVESKALDAAIAKLEASYGAPSFAPAAAPSPGSAQKPAGAPAPEKPPARLPPAVEPPAPPVPSSTARPQEPPPQEAPRQEVPRQEAPPQERPLVPAAPIELAPPPPPAPDSAEALPEPGPPVDFVPFVPPPRKPKPKPAQDPAPDEATPPAEASGDSVTEPPPATAPASPEAQNGRQRPRIDVKAPRTERSRLLRNLLVAGILAVVIGLIAVAAYFLRDKPSDLAARSGEQAGEPVAPIPDSKLPDRVGGERPPEAPRSPPAAAELQQDVSVAQRAVIFEENTADAKAAPASKTGQVIWRLETVSGEQGQPLQTAIRADVGFPEIGLTLMMTIRKNLDATLPASHTIELVFSSKDAESGRIVQDIGLLQAKDDERGRGAPVSGLPVRVAENLFLIGLSNLPNDIVRNTEMLRNREWLDIPLQYKAGPRAMVSFEKGPVGRRVIESAFDQWRD